MLLLRDAYLELAGTVVNASTCCDIWWELQNAENPRHERYRSIVERYDLFFEANAGAQLVAMVVLLYQAYETRSDTQNFHHFVERLNREEPAAGPLVASLRQQIGELKPIWGKVARARSTAIAHLSNGASSDILMQRAELTPNEIRALIVASTKMLKEIAAYFGILGTALLEMNAVPDTRRLMQDLDRPDSTTQAPREDARAR
jgi:hypothetical protein